MPLQMKLSQSDQRLYSPDRDLAYCGPHLIARAMAGLDPGRQEQWVQDYLEANHITNDDLVAAASTLADYVQSTLLDPQYKQPFDALSAANFFNLPPAVQTIVCAKIGQVLLSTMFVSMRDVIKDVNSPPMDINSIVQAAEDFELRVSGRKRLPTWIQWIMKKIGLNY